jgi:uncharacterized protein YsxB (DUF464 family)
MINIVFKKKEYKLVSYSVNGHAEYEHNDTTIYDDVVCGVVSNLAQVTILGVTEVLKLPAAYVAEEGDISLNLEGLLPEELNDCQVLMETMLLGLKNLEISYGEYIKILVEEVQ